MALLQSPYYWVVYPLYTANNQAFGILVGGFYTPIRKNMQPSNWIISPGIGVKIPKMCWNHHLAALPSGYGWILPPIQDPRMQSSASGFYTFLGSGIPNKNLCHDDILGGFGRSKGYKNMESSCWASIQGTIGCTPNSVPMVLIAFSRDSKGDYNP